MLELYQIEECAQGPGYLEALHVLDVLRVKFGPVQNKNHRDTAVSTECHWHRDMEFRRHDVGEIMNYECCFM